MAFPTFLRLALGRLLLLWRAEGMGSATRSLVARLPFHRSELIRFQRDLSTAPLPPPVRQQVLACRGSTDALETFRRTREVPFQFHLDRLHGVRRFYLGYLDGQLAGITWVYRTEPSPDVTLGPGEAEIRDSYVLPEFRRRGVYMAILTEALRDLSNDGVKSVYCHVDSANEASLAVKTHLGFRRLGAVKATWILGYRHVRWTPEDVTDEPSARG